MNDREKTIVPLDDAHAIFAAFGIGPENSEYQRWRRDDGFPLVDFEGVLHVSQQVLSVDWREWLQDALETVASQLDSVGIALVVDLDDEGEQGEICIAGRRERVKYVPNDEDDFADVIAAINRLIAGQAEYRMFRSCIGSDGWWYGFLTSDQWRELEGEVSRTLELLFMPG
jgi:hypothetical protein